MQDNFSKRFIRNLDILKIKNQSLYKEVVNNRDRIKLIISKNGFPTFKYKGIYIESRISPGNNILNTIHNSYLTNTEGKKFIFLGSGLSYHINRILDETDSNAVLIEKELDIFIASLFILKSEILNRLVLIINRNYDQTIEEIKDLDFSLISIIKHTFSLKFNREYYGKVELYIGERIKEDIASGITTEAQKNLWERNTLRNIINIRDNRFFTTKYLQGRFNGPVVLIASGPSVDNVIGLLKRLHNHIPIIALLPSQKLLDYFGIKPDALFTTDPGFWNKERFISETNIPLITTFSVNHLIPKNWHGRIYYFSHGLNIEKKFYEITGEALTIPMQGTSSIVMILLARLLGFNPIYLTGFDFCSVSLKDHHLGAGFDKYLIARSNRQYSWYTGILSRFRKEGLKKIKEKEGIENIYTTHKLVLYKSWLEKWVVGSDLFNISEIWPIKGIKNLDFKNMENYLLGFKQKQMNKLRFNQVLLAENQLSIIEHEDLRHRLESATTRAREMLLENKGKIDYFADF